MDAVFSPKQQTALQEVMVAKRDLACSHLPFPTHLNARDIFDRVIKSEHQKVMETCEGIVGNIQCHSNITLQIKSSVEKSPHRITIAFPTVYRLLPAYAHGSIIDRSDPFWKSFCEWFDQRLAMGERFAEAWWVLNWLNHNAGSLGCMKLYFNGITALMQGSEALAKRAELTREVRVPSNMPSIRPEVRAAGIRATQLLGMAQLFHEKAQQPLVHVQQFGGGNFQSPLGSSLLRW